MESDSQSIADSGVSAIVCPGKTLAKAAANEDSRMRYLVCDQINRFAHWFLRRRQIAEICISNDCRAHEHGEYKEKPQNTEHLVKPLASFTPTPGIRHLNAVIDVFYNWSFQEDHAIQSLVAKI